MRTNKSIRLHSKCLQVLEAIQTLNNRIEGNRATSLELAGKFDMFPSSYVQHYKNRLVIDKAIAHRLERYYNRLLLQAVDVAVKPKHEGFFNDVKCEDAKHEADEAKYYEREERHSAGIAHLYKD